MTYDRDDGSAKSHRDSDALERGMRRSLGVATSGAGHRRRFARDGDVPVVVVRGPREDGRKESEDAIQAERAARAQAERSLAAAQATIRDLQTKLAHQEMSQAELQRSFDRLSTEMRAPERAAPTDQPPLPAIARPPAARPAVARPAVARPPVARPAAIAPAAPEPVDWWSRHEP